MKRNTLSTLVFLALGSSQVFAGQLDVPNTFQSGQVASAGAVNANFAAAKTAVDDNNARIDQLLTRISTLEGQVADLLDIISVSSPGGLRTVTFSGVNVRIVNGNPGNNTYSANGLGNLIVGYNAGSGNRGGSHNLVVGDDHAYSGSGGAVLGFSNTITGRAATVTGGNTNVASGDNASVSGGEGNTASGLNAAISGGSTNVASGRAASVTGGQSNNATAVAASVAGGAGNTASGVQSHVSGGGHPTTANLGNTAATTRSVVLGGQGRTTAANDETIPAIP